MSDKAVNKAMREEAQKLINANKQKIGMLIEEKQTYANQIIADDLGEMSLMMISYHYGLIDDEIGELRHENRQLNTLQTQV